MARFLVFALALLAFLPVHGDNSAPIAINKRAPIEALDASGNVSAVTEAKVGDKYSFVNLTADQLTLQDAQGNHYRIAVSATDYVPPAPTATVAPAPPPAPVASTPAPQAPPIPAPPVIPPPPTVPPPDATTTASSSPAGTLPPESAFKTIQIGNRDTAKDMSIWPPDGIADRPLLIAAHGNGGAGPREIKGWLSLAHSHNFTIVCPSFLSSVNAGNLAADDPYLRDCIKWIKDNLQFSHENVFMAGFSGGGFPTWYLATQHSDFFHGLAFQSGNFAGSYYNFSLSRWYNRPIKLIWGSQDLADIAPQNQDAVKALKSEGCKNYTTEVVPGGHHQEHPDLVVAWMEQNLAKSDPNSP